MLKGTAPISDAKPLAIHQNIQPSELKKLLEQITNSFSPETVKILLESAPNELAKTPQEIQDNLKDWWEKLQKDLSKSRSEYKAANEARIKMLERQSRIRELEHKLLAWAAMGLLVSIPQGFGNEVHSMAKLMQKRVKGLQIPEKLSYTHTPLLNQALGNLLKEKVPTSNQIVASATLLAQLGVPENNLVEMVTQKDLKGLLEQFKKFEPQASDNTSISLNPLEKIRQMAE